MEKAELRRTRSYWENQAETFQLLIYQILDTGRKVAAESICQQATADYFLLLYLGNHFTKELKNERGTDWFAEPETLGSNLETSFSAQSFWFLMKAAELSFPLMEEFDQQWNLAH